VGLVDRVRMDTQNTPKRIAGIVILAVTLLSTGYPDFIFSYGGPFDLPIPDPTDPDAQYGRGWMKQAPIDIPDHMTINDIDVAITIEHTCAFDLQMLLKSPTGAGCLLNSPDLSKAGPDYTNTIFDDEADRSVEEASPPYSGRLRPQAGSMLSIFDGSDAFGVWTLQIYDCWYNDTGTLKDFQLIITTSIPEPAGALTFCLAAAFLAGLKPARRKPYPPAATTCQHTDHS